MESTTTPVAAPVTPEPAAEPVEQPKTEFVRHRFSRKQPETPKAEAKEEPKAEASPTPEKKAEPAKDPAKEPESKAEKADSGTKVSLKVFGEEKTVDLDEYFPGIKKIWKDIPEDQRQKVITRVQKMEAADRVMSESSLTKKQAASLIKALQTDPLKVLKHPALGHKPEKLRELLENEVYEYVKLENMDPKDRELMEVKHKLQIHEEEKQRVAKEAEEKELSELTTKYRTDYQKTITEALDTAGLPTSEIMINRTAYYLKQALDRGVRVNAGQVMDLVKADFQKWFEDLYKTADGDRLIALFGEGVADKINKARLTKLKASDVAPKIVEGSGPPESKAKTLDEWREENRQRRLKRA